MNKNELKKMLKPLIKECIKEVVFEEGTLSTIISEVAVGLGSVPSQPIVETKKKDNTQLIEQRRKKEIERKRRLLDAIGKDSYNGVNVFEGTTPMSASPSASSTAAPGPLSGVDPNDAGVDISSIMGHTSKLWERITGK